MKINWRNMKFLFFITIENHHIRCIPQLIYSKKKKGKIDHCIKIGRWLHVIYWSLVHMADQWLLLSPHIKRVSTVSRPPLLSLCLSSSETLPGFVSPCIVSSAQDICCGCSTARQTAAALNDVPGPWFLMIIFNLSDRGSWVTGRLWLGCEWVTAWQGCWSYTLSLFTLSAALARPLRQPVISLGHTHTHVSHAITGISVIEGEWGFIAWGLFRDTHCFHYIHLIYNMQSKAQIRHEAQWPYYLCWGGHVYVTACLSIFLKKIIISWFCSRTFLAATVWDKLSHHTLLHSPTGDVSFSTVIPWVLYIYSTQVTLKFISLWSPEIWFKRHAVYGHHSSMN